MTKNKYISYIGDMSNDTGIYLYIHKKVKAAVILDEESQNAVSFISAIEAVAIPSTFTALNNAIRNAFSNSDKGYELLEIYKLNQNNPNVEQIKKQFEDKNANDGNETDIIGEVIEGTLKSDNHIIYH